MNRRIKAIFNRTPNCNTLDKNTPEEIIKIIPRAEILFLQTDTNEVEISINCYPSIQPTKDLLPACHQLAGYLFSAFNQALTDGIENNNE